MDKRIQKTRAAIRKAYFSLLSEKDIKKITISDIARRANIDRKTFYLHYENTDDIIQEFYHEKAEELVLLLKTVDFTEKPSPIKYLFEIFNQMIGDSLDFFKTASTHPEYIYFFQELSDALVDSIVSDCSHLFPFSKEELRIYATFYMNGIVSVYVLWIKEGEHFDAERLASMVSAASVHGLDYLMRLPENNPSKPES